MLLFVNAFLTLLFGWFAATSEWTRDAAVMGMLAGFTLCNLMHDAVEKRCD